MKSAAFHMKSAAFCEKRRFSKDHLQGIVTLCFVEIDGIRLKIEAP